MSSSTSPRRDIYWQLLALTAAVFLLGWLIARSRLGFALRVIGEDETVAKHCGINTTFAKVALFTISATVMTLVGAIMAPRWTYIEPSIAFNSMISFQVLIMALLGGAHRLWGPVLGAVPLTLLFELLSARFPNTFTIILGCIFLLIVYMLPRGVAGLFEKLAATPAAKPRNGWPHEPGNRHTGARSRRPAARASAGWSRSTTSALRSGKARSWACSAPTAPARRRRSI